MDTGRRRIADLDACIIRPAVQADARAVTVALKECARAHPAIAALMASETVARSFVIAALSLSPFLRETALSNPALLADAVYQPLTGSLDACCRQARQAWTEPVAIVTDTLIMARLRQAKKRACFIIALADLSGLFDGIETTRWLSAFADAAVAAAIDHLLASAVDGGKLAVADRTRPGEGSGLVVLGMGKLGAGELNYSSDIDLVIFYDPDSPAILEPDAAPELFARLLRRLVRILQERTGDGYVFRTDLRLRPDPGATPLAIPVDAALVYYEGRGQNWERAAFIKARAIAGDFAAGAAFLREMTPFVFRKYLDYAAIADIHSIKRQIHAHRGHSEIAIKGHNVKLGRGGIREIEFFVQTQQLIAGGRMPELRLRRTDTMLAALAGTGWIDRETANELVTDYWFLRNVEHRLQMVRDEQTHLLPETQGDLRRIAFMAGFSDVATFSKALLRTLTRVERRYAQLFEQEALLSGEAGNLVFTGQNDDPDTLETLRRLGFERPHDIARTIRTWHSGRYRATQSVEARERLTALTPELLRVFGQGKHADEALQHFDRFIAGLPAGIQLFSLLGNNRSLLNLIVTIMSSAPRLAAIIAARPHVFDGMLDPGLLAQLPTREFLAGRIEAFVAGASHYEETLDRLRILAAEQRFLIGVRLLTGSISGAEAGRVFTDLADLVIAATLAAVLGEIEVAHGRFPGGRVAVIGMGKLGSRELTAGSDVDLILLYDHDDDAGPSDGAKPLDSTRYFTRITQRLIAALSSPTAQGVLYAVDMRLRPSGNKGPVATRVNAFSKYQRTEAWTWEHMALTRARPICGEESLVTQSRAVIAEVLAMPRDRAKIAADVADMRALVDKEKPARDIWDLKLIPGGLVDIEFIAQYLVLVGSKGHATELDTGTVLRAFGPATLAIGDIETLLAALRLYTDVSQIVRLSIDGFFDPEEAPEGLRDLLCRAADVPDLQTLESEIRAQSQSVRRIFTNLLA